MKTEFKDVMHLYIGCQVQIKIYGVTREVKLCGLNDDFYFIWIKRDRDYTKYARLHYEVKPILRPLSNMTDDEMKELLIIGWPSIDQFTDSFKFLINDPKRKNKCGNGCEYVGLRDGKPFVHGTLSFSNFTPEQTLWLLSKHFDLFGLIESGQAIDKTTLSQPEREEGK